MAYLLDALRRRELFSWLRLDPRAAWHGLLFRDRYNWHGITAALDPALRASLATQPGTLTQVFYCSPDDFKPLQAAQRRTPTLPNNPAAARVHAALLEFTDDGSSITAGI